MNTQTTDGLSRWKVLVVDDDPDLLSLIKELLRKESYQVETAENASVAWEKLNQPVSNFDFVMLDRIMPGMSGLELLRQIKADRRLRSIPIIMQSGASSPEEIAEGIEAGVFYYLTKPFTPKALLAIARSVVADISFRTEVAAQAAKYFESLIHFTYAELRFSTLEDINRVAGILAAMCPDPESASTGLLELLLNAIEHGNLGITYEEKKQLMLENRWEAEVRRRLALPEYVSRVAKVCFERKNDSLEFRITDQGKGFDWTQYLKFDPQRSLDPNGRGIALARRISFSDIEYQGAGNIVVATVST
jgi:CheY-like chemotaxis protein